MGPQVDDQASSDGGSKLLAAVKDGPLKVAQEIESILQASDPGDDILSFSVEWVSEFFNGRLGREDRSTVRAALLILLLRPAEPLNGRERMTWLTTLCSEIEFLESSPISFQDQLMTTVREGANGGRGADMAVLLEYLAVHGEIRSVGDWTTHFNSLGTVAASACAQGMLRHGSVKALRWIADTLSEDLQEAVLADLLPTIVAEDPDGLASILTPVGQYFDPKLRATLFRWLPRYGISIYAKESSGGQFDPEASIQGRMGNIMTSRDAIELVSPSESSDRKAPLPFTSIEELHSLDESVSAAQAFEVFLWIDESAEWPVFLEEALSGVDDAAETGQR